MVQAWHHLMAVRQGGMRTDVELTSHYLQYVQEIYGQEPSGFFAEAKQKSQELGKAQISISAAEGRLVSFFVGLFGCKKFIEIGALTGYSALWILHGMKKGELFTLEKEPAHIAASKHILGKAASADQKVHLIEGDAEESLLKLSEKGPFDGIFIDGNKGAYLEYLLWAEKNLAPGSLILADNVFLRGGVWGDPSSSFSQSQIKVLRQFNQRLADPKKFESVMIPTGEGLFVAKLLR